jgi:hypothetical protein
MPDFDRRRPADQTIWTVDAVFSPDECAQMIASVEAMGFEEALITTGRGMVMNKSVRNNDRVIFDDAARANAVFARVKDHLLACIDDWDLCGLNERFRAYRYDPGQRFKPHFDGCFVREYEVEESAITMMIYLNDNFVGGATQFHDYEMLIRPTVGRVLFFFHPVLHEGCEVVSGRKYVLRTDVMYRRRAMVQ